jgi:hypothetical protein
VANEHQVREARHLTSERDGREDRRDYPHRSMFSHAPHD